MSTEIYNKSSWCVYWSSKQIQPLEFIEVASMRADTHHTENIHNCQITIIDCQSELLWGKSSQVTIDNWNHELLIADSHTKVHEHFSST
jgi:hypothetical protein